MHARENWILTLLGLHVWRSGKHSLRYFYILMPQDPVKVRLWNVTLVIEIDGDLSNTLQYAMLVQQFAVINAYFTQPRVCIN